MDDTVGSQKLPVFDTIKEGVSIGVQNIVPILVNILLWVITIWIPYFNVGTTIGLLVGIVSKASRGEVIPMTEVFDPKYRKYMGEYFLVSGLVGLGVGIGSAFFIIPGFVIALAWSLSTLLVIDKGKNPTEAITLSNNCTYGHKWRMAGVYFITCLCFMVIQFILIRIGASLGSGMFFISILMILLALFQIFVFIGLMASIYKQLTRGI
jgi:hypothetical protein